MKVFWLFNHPAPYKVDFFNALGQYCDLDVLFERSSEKGRNSIFYSEKPLRFTAHVAHSIYLGGVDNYTTAPISYLKKNRYDIIVLNGWRTLTEQKTIRYCQKKGIPYLFYINGGILNENEPRWLKKLKTRCISGATAYLCPDKTSAKYLRYYGADPNAITIYPYSSIFERQVLPHVLSKEEKEEIRKELGLEGRHIYISSGQFIERKNFEELIRLWAKMPQEDTLYITGEGPLRKKYERMRKQIGEKNFHLLPYQPHSKLLRLFQACDGFVFLSKYDIYGHVINEALSQGLPVVAGDNINAAKHLIENGKNGYVLPLSDREGILNAMQEILKPSFAEEALKTASVNTIDKSAEFHFHYLEQYLKEHPLP